MVGHVVRRAGFNLLDTLRGSPSRRALVRVQKIMDNTQEGERYAGWAVRQLLRHAQESTDFYGQYPRGVELHELPVVNKEFIRDNTDRLVSQKYSRGDLAVASTSGSTGTPLKVYQDASKRFWRNIDTLFFGSLLEFQVGMRMYNLKIWSARNQQPSWKHSVRNTRPVDVVNLDDQRIVKLLDELTSLRQPAAIISYSSALDQLARYLERHPEVPKAPAVRAIIAQSEPLSLETRNLIGERLGVFPTSRYGMEEVGIVAQEGNDWSKGYRINRAGVHVELLALDADVLAPAGEIGRIVVTDLHNFAMPIIRYDTGDVGRFRLLPNGKADMTRLESIEGRLLDQITDTAGRHVSPFVFYKSIWKYDSIRQFQLAQVAKNAYQLRLLIDGQRISTDRISNDFLDHLGADADFSVQFVDSFPVLASGKRRQVVNEIDQS